MSEVIVARLEPGDVPEDIAADRLAKPLVSPLLARTRAATGRVNLAAEVPGLLRVDAAMINRLNTIDESLTIGTLAGLRGGGAEGSGGHRQDHPVLGTRQRAGGGRGAGPAEPARRSRCIRSSHLKVGLVVTELPGLKDSVTEKTHRGDRAAGEPADRLAAAAAAYAARGSADRPRRWNR